MVEPGPRLDKRCPQSESPGCYYAYVTRMWQAFVWTSIVSLAAFFVSSRNAPPNETKTAARETRTSTESTERNLFDHGCLDLLSLVIWSRVF